MRDFVARQEDEAMSTDAPLTAEPLEPAPATVDAKAARTERLRLAHEKYRAEVAAGIRPARNKPTLTPEESAARRKAYQRDYHLREKAKKAEAAGIVPNPEALAAPAPIPAEPRAPRKPSQGESRRAIEMTSLVRHRGSSALMSWPPSRRFEGWINLPAANLEIQKRPGFSAGWLSVLWDVLPTCSRVPALERLRPILEGLRAEWFATMSNTERNLFDDLPDLVTVWRSAGPQNKVGLTWCSTPAAARYYATLPPIRTREPVLIEALVDKGRIVHLRETLAGFEVYALAEPADLISETPIR